MSKRSFQFAFAVGLAAVAWIAWGFVASASWLALAMTAVIGAVYLFGALELRQFRADSTGLATALADLARPPASLQTWLDHVPPALRDAVRLRVDGERGSLPGPALTPYLAGLLVMLGMLGTFLGMVVTFKGVVFALEGSTDLQAIRSALAAPIKGLGLAFGASVAGVAASAMLGLMSAISRRERQEVARLLERAIAGVLQPFSLGHQRQQAFRALQEQSRSLPEMVNQLAALVEGLERRNAQLDERLSQRQAEFHREVTLAYTALARDVGSSLQDSLAASARAAGESIRPAIDAAMKQIVQEAQRTQQRLGEVVGTQVDALGRNFEQGTAALLAGVADTLARMQAQQAHADAEARRAMAALRQEESERGQAAVARLGDLEAAASRHLATLGAALEEPITRLLHTASEVPQAAAGVIAQLRQEMSRAAERDNAALQERTALLERMASLLDTVGAAAAGQREAAEGMAAHITAGAMELASVAEAFAQGVQLFQGSSDKLAETLRGVEASLARSTARSDEQLAYYVAQAREVIDLSIASQQGVLEHLRQLQARPAKALALADGAAA